MVYDGYDNKTILEAASNDQLVSGSFLIVCGGNTWEVLVDVFPLTHALPGDPYPIWTAGLWNMLAAGRDMTTEALARL